MSANVKEVFKKHGSHLVFDDKLYEQLRKFANRWMMKGEHIEFLSGNTIGEQKLTFSILDENVLFQEVLKMDISELSKDIESIPEVNPAFKETSNERYHTIVWLIHGFYKSKLKKEEVIKAVDVVYNIFAYMKISSLISGSTRFRKNLADHNAAVATYERLPMRFIIKEKESWNGVFAHGALDFLPRITGRNKRVGIYYDRVNNFTTDDVLRMIMGMSTKLTGYINNIYAVYMNVINEGVKGKTTSIIEDHGEDGTNIKDIDDDYGKHVTYINSIIHNRRELIQPRLIGIITNLAVIKDDKLLIDTLEYMSDNYLDNIVEMKEIIEVPIIGGIEYLNRNRIYGDNIEARIIESLELLKGKWISPKGHDDNMYKFKEKVQGYVKEATGKSSAPLLVKTTIGVGLYIYLRSIVGDR